ncbi:MAG: methyltransferase domain-containing protein [Rhodobacteraceae bacterium]|nr:methyltransferase domain-containing protein [Paracoccaceae bacterium]
MAIADWDQPRYAAYRDVRLRPALDLLARVPADLPPGDVVDLGCGDGAVAAALAAQFAGRRITGVDAATTMLAQARLAGVYDQLLQADIAAWQAVAPPALIFSNAALHWLSDHDTVLPRLARMLAPGGLLAVQMPAQFLAPSHALLRQIAEGMFPDRFDFAGYAAPVHALEAYHAMLSPFGAVAGWETTYLQTQPAVAQGHPVCAFTQSTAMRPFLDKLRASEAARFTAAYDVALHDHYPLLSDGGALFPFRRLFFTLKV